MVCIVCRGKLGRFYQLLLPGERVGGRTVTVCHNCVGGALRLFQKHRLALIARGALVA